MGILFNLIVIYPLRRLFDVLEARRQRRMAAGKKVFPLKPDTVFILSGGVPLLLLFVIGLIVG